MLRSFHFFNFGRIDVRVTGSKIPQTELLVLCDSPPIGYLQKQIQPFTSVAAFFPRVNETESRLSHGVLSSLSKSPE